MLIRIIYASWFYLAIAGCLGALAGWAVLEPFFDDFAQAQEQFNLAAFLLFPTVAGSIGLFLGAAEGIMCRNPQRAFTSAVVGLGIGFGGGIAAIFLAGMVFKVMKLLAALMPQVFALLVFMMGRGAGWAIAA